MISEKRLQPVRTIGFFCTVIVLKIFNLSHLLLDLAPSVDSHSSHLATRPQCCTVIIMVYYNHGFPFGQK